MQVLRSTTVDAVSGRNGAIRCVDRALDFHPVRPYFNAARGAVDVALTVRTR
jgi:hypothetical protein